MHDQLLWFVARGAPFLGQVFERPFDTPSGWLEWLRTDLEGGASGILNRIATRPSSARPFQALFIACWIHQPVEKGSYMIPLPRDFAARVKVAVEGLPTRWSSHLSESNARSAGQGYAFLKGYSELLVQIETDRVTQTPHLFLKTEGHGAMSLAHISSYITKLRSGEGNTQSEALHRVATSGLFGIAPRAAENYSKGYEALLKNVEAEGKLVDAATAIPAVCAKLARKVTLENRSIWDQWLASRAAHPDQPPSNLAIADLIDRVIMPTLDAHTDVEGKHLGVLRKSRSDLAQISRDLRRDVVSMNEEYVPRFFGEIRAKPELLDQSLNSFRTRFSAEVHRVRTAAGDPRPIDL